MEKSAARKGLREEEAPFEMECAEILFNNLL